VAGQARRAWLLMLVAVGVGFAAAVAVARAQASRLAAPIRRLADRAAALGGGDFTGRVEPCGIDELDTVGQALDASGVRLAELLARERAFSADVSHQLRTPLAGLRLRLEHAAREPGTNGHVDDALVEVDRLEATVEHLLALARDDHSVTSAMSPVSVVEAAADRWRPQFAEAGRTLRVDVQDHLPPARGTAISVGQVLDVLLDNALRHGGGTVDLRARAAAGGLVIEVADAGSGIPEDQLATVFERRSGEGTGIGLGLARTITEADGGRLLAVAAQPPTFHVVLPTNPG
jgi:signal transduction histidine kinase